MLKSYTKSAIYSRGIKISRKYAKTYCNRTWRRKDKQKVSLIQVEQNYYDILFLKRNEVGCPKGYDRFGCDGYRWTVNALKRKTYRLEFWSDDDLRRAVEQNSIHFSKSAKKSIKKIITLQPVLKINNEYGNFSC